jgi:hypothetical protein
VRLPRQAVLCRAAAAIAVLGAVSFGAAGPAYADGDDRRSVQQRADQLHRQARSTATDLSAARAQLVALAARANAALDVYQRAAFAARAAHAAQQQAERRLAAATAAADQQRTRISVYVTEAYRTGGMDSTNLVIDILTHGASDDLLQRAVTLQTVGQRQADEFTRMRAARIAEQEARAVSSQAAAEATKSAQAAAAAKQQADVLVAQQQRQVAALEGRLRTVNGAARTAAAHLAALKRAEAIARAMGPVGACKGADVSGYPNGRLPESSLCPLWGAAGHRLRADAAAAFNRMSRAFAARFGTPICVTDSYRSYPAQVRVYAEKPGLAARPGTSNHGWGLAADLCGGIQTDGTSTNAWLRQNAGRFAWFHPSWADPGSSGPYEPWHWEYAGG